MGLDEVRRVGNCSLSFGPRVARLQLDFFEISKKGAEFFAPDVIKRTPTGALDGQEWKRTLGLN